MNQDNLILLFFIIMAIIGIWVFFIDETPKKPASKHPKPSNVSSSKSVKSASSSSRANSVIDRNLNLCYSMVEECESKVSMKLNSCNRTEAKSLLMKALKSPLKIDACRSFINNLTGKCSEGCYPDYSSLVPIPGRVKVKLVDKRDSEGICVAVGTRPVSLSFNCIKLKNSKR